jgi:DNA-binding response OmpR family regulator
MPKNPTALVIGGTEEQFRDIDQKLIRWNFIRTALTEHGIQEMQFSSEPNLILLFAQDNEERVSAVCEQLRNRGKTSTAPILILISKYQIAQGNVVKSMGNADFLIKPFTREAIEEKVSNLLTLQESSSH